MRYKLASCRNDDLLVPDYVSGEDTEKEDEHRYKLFGSDSLTKGSTTSEAQLTGTAGLRDGRLGD
jgi:hypothetical protein